MYIAIEGVDGAGKTTLTQHLANWIRLTYKNEVRTVHDPDDEFILTYEVRHLWKENNSILPQSVWALFFSVSSVGSQYNKNGVVEMLKRGYFVVSDRTALSNYAYFWDLNMLNELDAIHTIYIIPDLIVYLNVDTNELNSRLCMRRNELPLGLNRIEQLKQGYQNSIRHVKSLGWNIVQVDVHENDSIDYTLSELTELFKYYLHK